jgi:hypothetical protein
MHIVAEYKEDTKEIFRVSAWTEIPQGAKNFLDITDREGSTGNVSNLIGKFVNNGQITDSVTQSAPVEETQETPAEEPTDE